MTRGMARVLACALAASLILFPSAAFAMTVEEAYAVMQHRHAELDVKSLGRPPAETAFLERLFRLIDLTIVEKVGTTLWFDSEGKKGIPFGRSKGRIDALIADLQALPAPAHLEEIRGLVVAAVTDQRTYFQSFQDSLDGRQPGGDEPEAFRSRARLVKSSSGKLHAAYNRLLAVYPGIGQRNFDAFYDHLCVLDLL